ncbi:MAG: hypothetical protein WCW87_02765 [Candidatus Paceibacterota bacterium]
MNRTNETYTVEVTSPLIRPGIKISTEVSKKYLVSTLVDLLEQVREFNELQNVPKAEK